MKSSREKRNFLSGNTEFYNGERLKTTKRKSGRQKWILEARCAEAAGLMIRTYTFITEMSKVCTIAAIMIEMRVDIDFEKVVGLLPTKNLNNGSS